MKASCLSRQFIITLTFVVAPMTAFGSDICTESLTPYKAEYATLYKNIEMTGQRELKRLGDTYLLKHEADVSLASIREESQFEFLDGQFRVDKYDMVRSVLGFKREYHTLYDWDKGNAQVTGRDEVTLPLDDEPLDLLSYQLAIRCDLEKGRKELSYPVVARDKIKQYNFRIKGYELLNTSVGELDTVIVERIRKGGKRSTLFWIAPDLNYLLVKLEQYEKKEEANYLLEINKVSFN